MSIASRMIHSCLIKHPAPDTTADSTGQLFLDENGQPIGDTTTTTENEFADATAVNCLVQERTSKWPEGPGAGSDLVDARIYVLPGTVVTELDKIQRTDVDPPQDYQVTFVDKFTGYGSGDHFELQVRRIPL